MTLSQLKAALRAGKQPEDIGEYLGSGTYRVAYAVGPFVVKEAANMYEKDWYRPNGFRFAPTVTVETGNGPYHIQLRYERLSPDQPVPSYDGDLFWKNFGTDRRGRYVAFDW